VKDSPADRDVLLAIGDLSFRYAGGFALERVSLTIRRGEFVALLGPNGAGKTTLFSLITRLIDGADGTICIDGWQVRHEPERALAAIGVVFQQPTLDLDLSVQQNLRYFAGLRGLGKKLADERIATELERLGVVDRRRERVRRLSGGHRRRVELARALLHRPRLLLLDEPTVGLDVPTRRQIVDHVHRLVSNDGLAALWATHLIDEIAETDRVIVLHNGRVRADDRVDVVVRRSAGATLAQAFDLLTAGSGARASA
jgi:ABC-2 type transport system ATP-binding protein